jgi:hypothetical protein
MFLKRNQMPKHYDPSEGAVGTEAVAAASQRLNARHFKYPSSGFVTRIEHSLLYTMIREPDIFPVSTVLQAIDEEDFSIYFYVRPAPGTITVEYDVSYAQLTALLALAGEEWPHDSEIPPTLCRKISQRVLRYADDHSLDRKTEMDELLQPLYRYAVRREARQQVKMLPWLVPALGASVVTGNPLPLYTAFVASNLVESKNIEKGANSTANTDRMVDSVVRQANMEQASLLQETYDFDETEDVVIDWS